MAVMILHFPALAACSGASYTARKEM